MSIVVLDRDGVINQDSQDYIKSAEEWQPIDGSIRAIKTISDKGYAVYVATNQAGLARGKFSQSDLSAMHNKLFELVRQAGSRVSGIIYCPHHPDDGCLCRKPATGMLDKIEARSGESLSGQPFVGDSLKDIEAARTKGCLPVLVRTGNGTDTQVALGSAADVLIVDSLAEFARQLTPAG